MFSVSLRGDHRLRESKVCVRDHSAGRDGMGTGLGVFVWETEAALGSSPQIRGLTVAATSGMPGSS